MLAREGEKDKEKDEDIKKEKDFFYLFFYFIFLSSQVELKEMSFQLLLENWQRSSIPDGGGKIIPPGQEQVKENVLESNFESSLWWYHEASLTSRSQTSGGDVDS